MLHKATNCFSYLSIGLFAPGWDCATPPQWTRLTQQLWSEKGQLLSTQHSSSGLLKGIHRGMSIYHTHIFLYQLWPNDLSLQRLSIDTVNPEELLVPSKIPLKTLRLGEVTTYFLCQIEARQGWQPRVPTKPRPCSGAAGSFMEVTWTSAVYLVPAGNSSKPLVGMWMLQSKGDVLSCLPSPTPGSVSDVHHVLVGSLISAGTWWSVFRSKMNSPQSCLCSLQ